MNKKVRSENHYINGAQNKKLEPRGGSPKSQNILTLKNLNGVTFNKSNILSTKNKP